MPKRFMVAGGAVAIAMVVTACSSSGKSSSSPASSSGTGTSSSAAAAPSAATSSSAAASPATPASSAPASSAPAGGSGFLASAQAALATASKIPTTVPSAAYGPVTIKPGTTLYHVACDLSLEGCSNLANSMKAAAAVAGVGFKVCDGGSTADTATACFNNAINAKPSAIIVNGIGNEGAGNGFASAAAAKIPIIGSFTGDSPGVPGVATEVAGDTCTAEGNLLAQWVIADSAGKANVVFFGTQTYACNIQRQAGFEAGMKACTTCTEKSIEFAIAAVATTLPSQIGAALTANPNTNYVVGTFDAVSLAATDQIRQSGKSIKVGGFDANAPNLALIAKSDIQVADVTTGAEDAGWAAVDAALRAVAGQKLPASTAVSTVLITPSNVAQIGQVFKGATGYQDAFKKLWGLS